MSPATEGAQPGGIGVAGWLALMAALLALLSSLLWGSGDFLGGTLSRRVHPVAVMQVTQGLGGVALLVIVVAAGDAGRTGAIGWGVAAGALGCIGLGAFYSALATGTMGVVAPVAATGVVIPVGVGLLQGDSPSLVQLAGIVVTVAGVVLASGPERGSPAARRAAATALTHPAGVAARAVPTAAARTTDGPTPEPASDLRPLLLSGIAAVGFGGALTLVARGSETSVAMTLLVMRITVTVICTTLLLTRLRGAVRPERRDLPTLATIATTDSSANGAFAVATTMGQVSISAVLASLYPAVTALLAWRLHGERLRRIQVVGVVATLTGVGLIAAG
ncbi:MAG TPA: DMT family transporter [Iamia sp.]|nr:DMT family transporter [Iamia sp.]